jgi:FkbM family methyltransferase
MREILTRYGRLFVPDNESDLIGRFLERYGEWGWDEVSFIAQLLPDNAHILDVGAFIGTFGIGLALQHSFHSLYFVEANPEVFPLLLANIERTIPRAKAILSLIANSEAKLRVVSTEDNNIGGTAFLSAAIADGVGSSMQVRSLSSLREELGPVDLLKLDTEGMEVEILKSDAEYLSRGETMIWAECNESPQSIELGNLLLSWGLDLYYFAFPSHNPDNFNGDASRIFPIAYEAGLLAAPKFPPVLTQELIDHHCVLKPIRSITDLKIAMWRTPRWGLEEWVNATAEEVMAMAGRALRGESFDSFLSTNAALPVGYYDPLHQRLAEIETAFRSAESLALNRLDEINLISAQLKATEKGLHEAESLAFARLVDINRAEDRARVAEEMLVKISIEALDNKAISQEAMERTIAVEHRIGFIPDEPKLRRCGANIGVMRRLVAPLLSCIRLRPRLHRILRRVLSVSALILVRHR